MSAIRWVVVWHDGESLRLERFDDETLQGVVNLMKLRGIRDGQVLEISREVAR